LSLLFKIFIFYRQYLFVDPDVGILFPRCPMTQICQCQNNLNQSHEKNPVHSLEQSLVQDIDVDSEAFYKQRSSE